MELYSVREWSKKDLMGTIAAVADMGYEIVELYSPYFEWTDDYAKQVREHLTSQLECRSLHSPARAFEPDNRAGDRAQQDSGERDGSDGEPGKEARQRRRLEAGRRDTHPGARAVCGRRAAGWLSQPRVGVGRPGRRPTAMDILAAARPRVSRCS
ncbi:MAG: hypothetical protein R2748_11985 [Bryobacterales bacterium]